jgi:polyhydroxyalkanoate synthase subunit PhaC
MDIERAGESPLTLNPVIGISREDLVRAGLSVARELLLQPATAIRQALGFWQKEVDVVFGVSRLAPAKRDARFADPSYRKPIFRIPLQSWLALEKTLQEWVDEVGFDALERERARFLAQLVADALAPSNFLLGNPSALRKARATRGWSLLRGLRHFARDLVWNAGMPSQVDTSAFRVGGNIATTEGAVVHRDPILELIQYRPRGATVAARPILIVPPQINKFYVYDLGAEKSMVRYLLERGFQVFMVSWRNPTAEHRDWGLEDYVDAIERALGATSAISASRDVHTVGACAGGITLAAALGHLAAKDALDCVASLTLMVNVLDVRRDDSVMGLFATDQVIEAARRNSARKGVLDGRDTARVFNWMRPNDLIWNYVAASYLHGDPLPTFDILYWNNDTTRLPARLHGDFLDFFKHNALASPGRLKIHGLPITLGKVTRPVFIVGGTTDHITPWRACYRSTGLFGGERTFVLSSAGHIQSLINPPGPSKRKFYTNPECGPDADLWRANATEHEGSWWPYWADWLHPAGAREKDAPAGLGDADHPVLCAAPGSYVHE